MVPLLGKLHARAENPESVLAVLGEFDCDVQLLLGELRVNRNVEVGVV